MPPEYRALETYIFKKQAGRDGAPLQCNVTVLGGSDDVFAGELVLGKWAAVTSGDFSLLVFDKAGHFFWKHSRQYEEMFLQKIVSVLFASDDKIHDERDDKDRDSDC